MASFATKQTFFFFDNVTSIIIVWRKNPKSSRGVDTCLTAYDGPNFILFRSRFQRNVYCGTLQTLHQFVSLTVGTSFKEQAKVRWGCIGIE